MNTTARRLSLALILGATSIATSGTALAQTGTDPCPRGLVCTSGNSASPKTHPASAAAKGSSVTGTVFKSALILLGLA